MGRGEVDEGTKKLRDPVGDFEVRDRIVLEERSPEKIEENLSGRETLSGGELESVFGARGGGLQSFGDSFRGVP